MALDRQSAMTDAETDAFLGRCETGVLALARDDDPYAIPISYGYDADDRRFFLRLVSESDSQKHEFLAGAPQARLVVTETEGRTYRSAIATGRLEAVPREEIDLDRIEQFGTAKRPLFEMWGESRADLDVDLYELDADELTGRLVVVDEDDDGDQS